RGDGVRQRQEAVRRRVVHARAVKQTRRQGDQRDPRWPPRPATCTPQSPCLPVSLHRPLKSKPPSCRYSLCQGMVGPNLNPAGCPHTFEATSFCALTNLRSNGGTPVPPLFFGPALAVDLGEDRRTRLLVLAVVQPLQRHPGLLAAV